MVHQLPSKGPHHRQHEIVLMVVIEVSDLVVSIWDNNGKNDEEKDNVQGRLIEGGGGELNNTNKGGGREEEKPPQQQQQRRGGGGGGRASLLRHMIGIRRELVVDWGAEGVFHMQCLVRN